MSTIRDLILGSLDSLSQPIEDVSPYLYTYSWSETLLEKAHDLYICILDAVEEITHWITKKRGGKECALTFSTQRLTAVSFARYAGSRQGNCTAR